jgi:cobalamin biosynthesis protein CobD/CbiB
MRSSGLLLGVLLLGVLLLGVLLLGVLLLRVLLVHLLLGVLLLGVLLVHYTSLRLSSNDSDDRLIPACAVKQDAADDA